mmetsp:Transcript_11115/g.16659  ORF Transcript_11115/g.16659 Transcript_11115/m.16659 type:complete len:222 (-) Transcript_11115:1630-2295(-)
MWVEKIDLVLKLAATVKTRSKHLKREPKISILPSRTCMGSFERCQPNGVSLFGSVTIVFVLVCCCVLLLWRSMAPTSSNVDNAVCTTSYVGGCGACCKNSMQFVAKPPARMLRQTSSSGTRCNSGIACGFMTHSAVRDENNLQHIPGLTRPARPCLCLALACEHQSVTRADVDAFLLFRTSRIKPESMTQTTSGMVMLVSAIFVEMIIFRQPRFGFTKARF